MHIFKTQLISNENIFKTPTPYGIPNRPLIVYENYEREVNALHSGRVINSFSQP